MKRGESSSSSSKINQLFWKKVFLISLPFFQKLINMQNSSFAQHRLSTRRGDGVLSLSDELESSKKIVLVVPKPSGTQWIISLLYVLLFLCERKRGAHTENWKKKTQWEYVKLQRQIQRQKWETCTAFKDVLCNEELKDRSVNRWESCNYSLHFKVLNFKHIQTTKPNKEKGISFSFLDI